MLLSVPGVILAAIVLTAPGVLWAVFCYPSDSYATRVAVGLALGLAFTATPGSALDPWFAATMVIGG